MKFLFNKELNTPCSGSATVLQSKSHATGLTVNPKNKLIGFFTSSFSTAYPLSHYNINTKFLGGIDCRAREAFFNRNNSSLASSATTVNNTVKLSEVKRDKFQSFPFHLVEQSP